MRFSIGTSNVSPCSSELYGLQRGTTFERPALHVGRIVVVGSSEVGDQYTLAVVAVDIALLRLHHMHVVVGFVVDGAIVPQRAFLEVVAVVGSCHVVAGWLLVGVIHHNVILFPDGVVGKLLIAVGSYVYLEVRTVLEDVESVEDEVVGTKSLRGVGTLRTVHEHIDVREVGASHEGAVGHYHLECCLVVYP